VSPSSADPVVPPSQLSVLRRLHRLGAAAVSRWELPGPARLRLLNHGENTVYGVRIGAEPEAWVLRIHRQGYHPRAGLRSEAHWLTHLHRCGIGAPEAVAARDGDPIQHVATPELPEGRHVSLLLKTHGRIRALLRWGPTGAARVGALLARLHLAAGSFVPPAGFTRRVLDAEGLVGPTAHWGDPLAEPTLTSAQAELFRWGRDRVREELARAPRGPSRWGLVHADLHVGNVLFAAGEARAIDFDDLATSWFVNDFVVNLPPLRWRDPASADALLAGYRAVRDLPDEDLRPFAALHCARRMTAAAWARSRADVPRLLDHLPRRVDFAARTLAAWRNGDDPVEVRP
jgi:Ser/Thr protein kinase RdoA (MazF antagonist)